MRKRKTIPIIRKITIEELDRRIKALEKNTRVLEEVLLHQAPV